MDEFFYLDPGSTPHHHQFGVEDRFTVNGPDDAFLFGGIALGACILAAERSTGRPTVWASAQYLSYARRGKLMEIEILPVAVGRHTAQARAVARVDNREVIGASLSLGARPDLPERQFARPQQLPVPDACPSFPVRWSSMPGDLYTFFDTRIAGGWDNPVSDGCASLWIRPVDATPIDRPLLALVGDFVAAAIGNMLGSADGDYAINSLDNSIRFMAPIATPWIQCDIRLHGVANGFAHGRMLLFTQNGELLASASQSVVVRNTLYPRLTG